MTWRRMDSLKEQSKLVMARPASLLKHPRPPHNFESPFEPVTTDKTQIALDYIYDLPDLPLPIRRLTPAGKIYEVGKLLAAGLIMKDPLNLIDN